MEKGNLNTPDIDVTDESYRGTSRVVTSAGYLYLSHMASTFGGMAVMGVAAFIAHKKVNNLVGELHNIAETSGRFRKGIIRFVVGDRHGSHELATVIENLDCINPDQKTKLAQLVSNEELSFFQHKASKLTDWISKNNYANKLIEKQPESRLQAGFIGASLGAVSGWLSSTIWSLYKGNHEGNKGKRQFARAKAQIKNLQEDNADLNKVNDDLHEKYVKAATRLDTIDAARDNAALAELPSTSELAAPMTQAPLPKTEVQLDTKMHQGKLAQQDLSAAVA